MSLFNSFYQLMKKISNWPSWGISLALLVLAYIVVNGDTIGAEHVRLVSGGTSTLDAFFFFTPGKAYEVLAALGEAGRSAYLTANLLDFVYPLTYTLFFSISMTMTYTFIYKAEDFRNWLILLPFGALLADYGETMCVRLMLLNYPTRLTGVAETASLVTPLKWVLIVACGLLILQGNMNVTNKLFGKK